MCVMERSPRRSSSIPVYSLGGVEAIVQVSDYFEDLVADINWMCGESCSHERMMVLT